MQSPRIGRYRNVTCSAQNAQPIVCRGTCVEIDIAEAFALQHRRHIADSGRRSPGTGNEPAVDRRRLAICLCEMIEFWMRTLEFAAEQGIEASIVKEKHRVQTDNLACPAKSLD